MDACHSLTVKITHGSVLFKTPHCCQQRFHLFLNTVTHVVQQDQTLLTWQDINGSSQLLTSAYAHGGLASASLVPAGSTVKRAHDSKVVLLLDGGQRAAADLFFALIKH